MKEFSYFLNTLQPIDDEHRTSRPEDLNYLKLLEPGRDFVRGFCFYGEEPTKVMADEIRYALYAVPILPWAKVPPITLKLSPCILRVDDVELSKQSGYELLDFTFRCHCFRTE